MSFDKKFTNVVIEEKKDGRRQITELTVLDEKDKNTIYNLIFAEKKPEMGEEGKVK